MSEVYADSIQAKVNGNAQAVLLRDSDAQEKIGLLSEDMKDVIGNRPNITWTIGAISGDGSNNDNSKIRARTDQYIHMNAGDKITDTGIGSPEGQGLIVYQYTSNNADSFETYTAFNNANNQTFTADKEMYVRLVVSLHNNEEFNAENLKERIETLSIIGNYSVGRLGDLEAKVNEIENKIIPIENYVWEKGGINSNTGVEFESNQILRTSMFFVKKGTAFMTNSFAAAGLTCQFRSIIEFDKYGNFVKNHTVQSPHYMYFAENDMFVRVSASKFENGWIDIDDEIESFIAENVHIVRKNTAGKLIYILGDSWTEQQRYVNELVRITGIDFVNYGVSSSQITNDKGETKLSFVTRVKMMDTERTPYIIIIEGGINDWIGDVPIGSLDEIERGSDGEIIVNSLMSAESYIIEYIQKTWSTTEILFVTNANSYWEESNVDATKPKENSNGNTPFDFARATETVCENYSIPCVNLAKSCMINGDNMAKNGSYMPDYIHPAVGIGANRVAKPISVKLLEMCIE